MPINSETRPARAYTDIVAELRDGRLNDELSDAVKELVGAVRATERAGKITLTLTFRMAGVGKEYTMEVKDEVKIVTPPPEKRGTIMFATPDNNVVRQDPKQLDMLEKRRTDGPGPGSVTPLTPK